MILNHSEIHELDRIKKINLINSISGIKPANLLGTQDSNGLKNLAIISSVIHLGSTPPLFGYILRPNEQVRRHTYENIIETGFYTINHIHEPITQNAHYTSAKFEKEVSEFDTCQLKHEYLADFSAPFVKDCKIRFGLKHVESIPIETNGTIMVIGEVQILDIADECIDHNGYIDLGKVNGIGISGLNSYYKLQKIADFPYARVNEVPDWNSEV